MSAQRDHDEDIELGEEVAVRRKKGSALVAVRVPTNLLHQIQAFARDRSLTVSDVLRVGAERLVQETASTGISMTMRTGAWSTSSADRWAQSERAEEPVVIG